MLSKSDKNIRKNKLLLLEKLKPLTFHHLGLTLWDFALFQITMNPN